MAAPFADDARCDLCGTPIMDARDAFGYRITVCTDCWCSCGGSALDADEREALRDMLCRCASCWCPPHSDDLKDHLRQIADEARQDREWEKQIDAAIAEACTQ